jgi:hypothetical protein
MKDRDDKIVGHIGRYGMSLRAAIEKLYLDGATSDHVIARLIKEKRIASATGIPGGLACYRLTLGEARAREIPEHRAHPKKGAALRVAIQVLWFCCMMEKNRSRLERKSSERSLATELVTESRTARKLKVSVRSSIESTPLGRTRTTTTWSNAFVVITKKPL